MTVVRGFIPAGLRSSPKIIQRGHLEKPCPPLLRLLRSRTGINPLTTGIHSRFFMAAPLAGWSGATDPIVAWNMTVVRGFIPAGLRSSPKTIQRGDSVRSDKQDLRLLRSRTGINPLTTGIHSRFFMAVPLAGWSGAADPIVAWNITVVRGFIQIVYGRDLLWRGDSSPLGCEAAPKPFSAVIQSDLASRIYDCCAAGRG